MSLPTRQFRGVLTALLAVALCSVSLPAQSTLNFPRLSFQLDRLTGIAVVNPNSTDAVFTATAYGSAGQVLTGLDNPVQRTIPANQQFSDLTSLLFNGTLDPATTGWIQVTSDTSNLTGFFLFLNEQPPFTVFDGADLPPAATSIVFTEVRSASGYSTELNIVNPGAGTASLTLQLSNSDLGPVSKQSSLPPKGSMRIDVQTFFEVNSATDAFVTVTSDAEIAGFELVRSPTGDLVGLNARPTSEQLTNLYFPQVAVLGGFQTRLGVVNNSAQAVVLTISAFQPTGSLFSDDVQENPVTRTLNPNSILVEDLESLFGFSGGQDPLEGWLQVTSSAAAVTGFLTYELPDLGAAATVTPNRLGQRRGIFSHIATVDDLFTGVAALNSGQLAANLGIFAVRSNGEVLGSFGTVLQPGHRISRRIIEFIPEADDQSSGFIFVRSDLPVHLTSLFGNIGLSVLSNIPPQTSPPDFNPDAEVPQINVTPLLAIVAPNDTQAFQVQGGGGSVVWKVNNMVGGDTVVGTIDGLGNYTAPPEVPFPRTVTVSAEVNSQTAGASVDVLDKQVLFQSLAVVQSVVYLTSLDNLFTAELTILSTAAAASQGPAGVPAQEQVDSEIFQVLPGGAKNSLVDFQGEEIAKMIPFTASNGQQFLLLAARTSGRVIRLDPETGATQDVATGLEEPSALVIDAGTGDLLVAEKSQVTRVTRAELEEGIQAARLADSESQPLATPEFSTEGASGVVVDRCTGNIYVSDASAGVIRCYDPQTRALTVLFDNLQQPGQILGLFRQGVSCPEAFQMLVAETGADRLLLITPSRGLLSPWLSASDPADVSFLSGGSSFAETSAILYTELVTAQPAQEGETGQITATGTPGMFTPDPDNPPPPPPTAGSEPPPPSPPPEGSPPAAVGGGQSADATPHPLWPILALALVSVVAVAYYGRGGMREDD